MLDLQRQLICISLCIYTTWPKNFQHQREIKFPSTIEGSYKLGIDCLTIFGMLVDSIWRHSHDHCEDKNQTKHYTRSVGSETDSKNFRQHTKLITIVKTRTKLSTKLYMINWSKFDSIGVDHIFS
jgi:hypothetical protein